MKWKIECFFDVSLHSNSILNKRVKYNINKNNTQILNSTYIKSLIYNFILSNKIIINKQNQNKI